MYLGITWQEPRILDPDGLPLGGPPKENQSFFALDTKFLQHLWVPDIYIYHLKYISRSLKDYEGICS